MGMDAEVDRRVQLAMTSESALRQLGAHVIKGYKPDDSRVAIDSRIKPKLKKLEIQTAESIVNVGTKIAEIEALGAQPGPTPSPPRVETSQRRRPWNSRSLL